MTVSNFLSERGIREVLHFTTRDGALGVLTTRSLIPNAELTKEQRIEFILKSNCEVRKDPRWTGHNSLSISTINSQFLQFSRTRHAEDPDLWWCILSFDPIILTHSDVVFCTGNNTWPRSRRLTGGEGVLAVFADSVPGRYDSTIHRPADMPPNFPTCDQAEVLYPGRLPLDFLRRIYFETQDHADIFLAWNQTLRVGLPDSVAEVSPGLFRGPR